MSLPRFYRARRTGAAFGGYGVAVRAAMAHRAHFVLQIAFMAINDLVWICFWLLLFNKAGNVRGWTMDEFLVLFAVVTGTASLAWGFCAGIRDTPRVLHSGELDALLTQPTPVLARLLARRLDVPLVGDLLFGVVVFSLSGYGGSVANWVAYACACMLGASVMLAFLVTAHSLVFRLAGRAEAGQLMANASLVFTMYPMSIFGGTMKLVLYTVVPSAFMAALPATLVLDFEWTTLAEVAAASTVAWVVAIVAWSSGLNRYRRYSL